MTRSVDLQEKTRTNTMIPTAMDHDVAFSIEETQGDSECIKENHRLIQSC